MPTILVPLKWKQEGYKFKAILDCVTSLRLQQGERECSKANSPSSAKSLSPSPASILLGGGAKRGHCSPPTRPLAQGPPSALTLPGTEFCPFPEFLSIHARYVATSPLLLLQQDLGLLSVPVNRDKQPWPVTFLIPLSPPTATLYSASAWHPHTHSLTQPPTVPSRPQTHIKLISGALTSCSLHFSMCNGWRR